MRAAPSFSTERPGRSSAGSPTRMDPALLICSALPWPVVPISTAMVSRTRSSGLREMHPHRSPYRWEASSRSPETTAPSYASSGIRVAQPWPASAPKWLSWATSRATGSRRSLPAPTTPATSWCTTGPPVPWCVCSTTLLSCSWRAARRGQHCQRRAARHEHERRVVEHTHQGTGGPVVHHDVAGVVGAGKDLRDPVARDVAQDSHFGADAGHGCATRIPELAYEGAVVSGERDDASHLYGERCGCISRSPDERVRDTIAVEIGTTGHGNAEQISNAGSIRVGEPADERPGRSVENDGAARIGIHRRRAPRSAGKHVRHSIARDIVQRGD